ncbi:MAG: lipocalin-like domain-containing protein [Terrimicrobiaceae bacterium]
MTVNFFADQDIALVGLWGRRSHAGGQPIPRARPLASFLLKGVVCVALAASTAMAGDWSVSLPGWKYDFPADHGNHDGFKTEWWYFTGNVADAEGRAFGYQLTFFRQGILPPGEQSAATSRFIARNIQFAHFAVSDLKAGGFHFDQKLSRGAYGEAGFDGKDGLAWIKGWRCELVGEHTFRLRADSEEASIDLTLESTKDPVFHGEDGISQKAEGVGRASHYYSLTRLKTRGTFITPSGTFEVTGWSWFDHEWATNQLAPHQIGWDWFSIHFDDGSDLMMFQIRTKDGGRDPFSSGTYVAADGTQTAITNADFELVPGRTWKSPDSGGEYPVDWKLSIPSLDLNLQISAAMDAQELFLQPIAYWEGAIRVKGKKSGTPASGSGYLEMTGYGSPIVGMQATE